MSIRARLDTEYSSILEGRQEGALSARMMTAMVTGPRAQQTTFRWGEELGAPARWEQSAAFWMQQAIVKTSARFYAHNNQVWFTIPCEFAGVSHHYKPDYLVRLQNGVTLVLEIKGMETEKDRAKHQAAKRWVEAVNNWKLGTWAFHVCKDPQMLGLELAHLGESTGNQSRV